VLNNNVNVLVTRLRIDEETGCVKFANFPRRVNFEESIQIPGVNDQHDYAAGN
jgi:hypothetical protein